jgi:hypothetical protein
MAKAVFCLVNDTVHAEKIVDELKRKGVANGDISILFPDRGASRDFSIEKETKAPEGYSTGVGVGGILGGVFGWLAGIGLLAIPGIGAFVAAGPIMAALSGAAIGAATGGIAGALIGLGMPEHVVTLYETKVKEGHILLACHASEAFSPDTIVEIYEDNGAHDISTAEEARAGKAMEVK